MSFIKDWLLENGVPAEMVLPLLVTGNVLIIAFLAFVANWIAKKIIIRGINAFIGRTRIVFLQLLRQHRVLSKLSHIAPAIVVQRLSPLLLSEWPIAIDVTRAIVNLYLIIVFLLVADSLLNVALSAFAHAERAKNLPLKGVIQALKLIIIIAAVILSAAVILGKSPLILFSGLGALTAVILLIFKDAILGFVASIQLTANDMVQTGDWIEMPKQGADGAVIDVSLTTVKVQNWDKTITTIPSYMLISDSFKNWRGMREAGGRRIKRAINIDIRSIRFLDEELLRRCEKIHLLRPYLKQVLSDIQEHNQRKKISTGDLINGRHLTNIGTFRAYCSAYIKQHKSVHPDLIQIVRQLAPGEHGLPLEIYLFTNTVAWVPYEGIQSDIFDHLLAILPHFDLRAFQQPSGADISALGEALLARTSPDNPPQPKPLGTSNT